MEGHPPPPPPPHGANAQGGRSGGLPDGKYDIFVIPPSSAGSGFLYLPSLQTNRNSFIAGAICAGAAFFIWNVTVPALKSWFYDTMHGGGGSGMLVLLLGVGVLSWAFGKTQAEASQGPTSGAGNPSGASGTFNPGAGAQSGPPPQSSTKSSWQRPPPQANPKANTSDAKSSWEKAREETRKKEEEKRKTEDLKKRREELEKERQKQRDKETQERLERERKEKKEREEREAAANKAKASPKRPPMPTARTEEEDDAYSFRPYDRARRPYKANSAASMYSESSYAPSQTTARTTPPPANHGPYNTKDPDKIIIKGVYAFTNAFMRTPTQQLVSGAGSVTDGLILRITTEGLFIDDDKRGVPQREWDVKAWTMKLAEVWCPNLPDTKQESPSKRNITPFTAAASRHKVTPSETESGAFVSKLLQRCHSGASLPAKAAHRFAHRPNRPHSSTGTDDSLPQSCEMAGLHVLRASIRDQEGKKYVFILSQSEGWKVAVGLQRLRRGSQVRALGVAGMPMNEAKALLESLGYV
jgi:hypothetical protein